MSDGDLSSKTDDNKAGSDSTGNEDGGHAPRLGERFRAPSSTGVGISDSEANGDEAVDRVANRFRGGPRLGEPVDDVKTLDETSDASESVDEGSILEALDGSGGADNSVVGTDDEEVARAAVIPDDDPTDEGPPDELPMVDVEPIDEEEDDADATNSGPVCPSCHAENPDGMRFCVECGGSLQDRQQSRGEAQLQGNASGESMRPVGDDRDPPPATDAAEQENPWDIEMVSINEDGTDGTTISLDYLETTVGRDGDDRFPTDSFLSPKHARFHVEDGTLFIEDLYSLNGTFIKLRDETRLTPGDTILMGRQVLRFERFDQSITAKTKNTDGTRYMGSPAPGGNFKVLQIGIGGVVQNVYCLPDDGAVLGREKGDIVFPHDKFMSGRHAQIFSDDDGNCYLVDLNSSNGTWIKIWEKTKLQDNDFVFMGQQLFRVDYGD